MNAAYSAIPHMTLQILVHRPGAALLVHLQVGPRTNSRAFEKDFTRGVAGILRESRGVTERSCARFPISDDSFIG